MEFSTNKQDGSGKQPVGAVLVVGAGIGGMQASLDLAEVGLKVYLLERSPAIGGMMAQLDKTFPTNDCSMCIMSPKLVEVGRHLNIDILTTADIEGISGEPGNFTVRVRQRPRYVNLKACTGCGDCAAACPVSRLDEFNTGLSERRAIYKAYPQAIPNAYAIEKLGVSPCRDACPINQRAQGYLALVREGRFADAYRTIKEDNPFPSVCGRVCNHRCEDNCSRNEGDTPVNIMALKRFVSDWWWQQEEVSRRLARPAAAAPTGKRVAVVGSGPAGGIPARPRASSRQRPAALRIPLRHDLCGPGPARRSILLARSQSRPRACRLKEAGKEQPVCGRFHPAATTSRRQSA